METRITVRLPAALYDRLYLFARGRSKGKVPDISAIVREALEAYLHIQYPEQHRQGRHKKH